MRPLARCHDLRARGDQRPDARRDRGDAREVGVHAPGVGLASAPVQALEHRLCTGDGRPATNPRAGHGHCRKHAHPHRHSASIGTHVVHALNLPLPQIKGYVE